MFIQEIDIIYSKNTCALNLGKYHNSEGKMGKIPLFIMEEHHEAFYIWNYAVAQQLIKPSNNTLLHVDEHSDLELPILANPVKSATESLEKLFDFTYGELSIADFIIPAMYQGIFNQLYWMRQKHDTEAEASEKMVHVFSSKGQGKLLIITPDMKLAGIFNPERKAFKSKLITSEDSISSNESVVLDIDLDYFSCDNRAGQTWELELTKEAYESFTKDPYNIVHMKLGGKGRTKEIDGKYYFCNSPDPYWEMMTVAKPSLKVSEETILERIDALIDFLERNSIQPTLIDICRSRLSQFTPEDQWEFIETRLIEKFKKLYEVEIKYMSDILPKHVLEQAV